MNEAPCQPPDPCRNHSELTTATKDRCPPPHHPAHTPHVAIPPNDSNATSECPPAAPTNLFSRNHHEHFKTKPTSKHSPYHPFCNAPSTPRADGSPASGAEGTPLDSAAGVAGWMGEGGDSIPCTPVGVPAPATPAPSPHPAPALPGSMPGASSMASEEWVVAARASPAPGMQRGMTTSTPSGRVRMNRSRYSRRTASTLCGGHARGCASAWVGVVSADKQCV
jgi:hypothetical protein